MNINKDGKTLYFSDEEIENSQDGEKKVFVTKRINGKESHVKAEKTRRTPVKHYGKVEENDSIFNFNDEIVIGVNSTEKNKEKNKNTRKDKRNNIKKRKWWQIRKKEKKNDRINQNRENDLYKSDKQDYDVEKSKVKIEKNKKNKQNEKNKKKQKINKLEIKNERNFENKNKNDIKKKKPKVRRIRIKNKKPLIVVTSVLGLFIAIMVLALTAPIFNITTINIEGNSGVPGDTIINLSGIHKGQNIFKFNKSVITKIKENTYIQEASIKRKLPGTVVISVKERSVKYQLNLINSYVYVDKNGYILEIASTKAEVPVITGLSITEDEMMNSKSVNENDLKELNKISKIIDAAKTIEIENLITEINIEDKNNFILYLESENKKIYVGDTTNLTNKMLYIKKILENEKSKSGIIFVNGDINQGFKPYFREE